MLSSRSLISTPARLRNQYRFGNNNYSFSLSNASIHELLAKKNNTFKSCNFSSSSVISRGEAPEKKPRGFRKHNQGRTFMQWKDVILDSKSVVSSESSKLVRVPPLSAPIVKNILQEYDDIIKQDLASEKKILNLVASRITDSVDSSTASQTVYAEDEAQDSQECESALNELTPEFSESEASLFLNLKKNSTKLSSSGKFSTEILPGSLIVKNKKTGIVLKQTHQEYLCLFSSENIESVEKNSFSFHYPDFLESDFVNQIVKYSRLENVLADFKKEKRIENFLPLAINILSSLENKANSFVMLNHISLLRFVEAFDEKDYKSFHVSELFQKFKGAPAAPHELLGFHSFLIKQFESFISDRELINHIVCYPKEIVLLSKELDSRVRSNHESFKSFINKAARLVKTRQARYNLDYLRNIFSTDSPAYCSELPEPASNFEVSEFSRQELLPAFSEEDKQYLRGIWQFVLTEKMSFSSSFAPLACAVIKPLGYSFVSAANAMEFLKDIGAVSVCENLNLRHYSLDLMERPTLPDVSFKLNDIKDPYASIRYDFEDMPVFTVDDPDAKEIDDGISIEPSQGDDSKTWLHVHIADPTTLIEPDSELDHHCRKLPLTVYTPEMTWPMLPKGISHGVCSLDSSHTGSRFVLTFSALLDQGGNISEFKIRPGLINNIVAMTYDEVNSALGVQDNVIARGSHPSSKTTILKGITGSVSSNIDLIKKIQKLMKNHFAMRIQNGALNIQNHSFIVKANVDSSRPLVQNLSSPDYTGYDKLPEISYRLIKNDSNSSQNMIAEAMIVAGRVATLYCKQNNLSLPFVSQASPSPDQLSIIDSVRSKDPSQYINLTDFIVVKKYFCMSELSLSPSPHYAMGLKDGYLRVTSPLRRYTDMLAHWQIKNHLLKTSGPPLYSSDDIVLRLNKISDSLQNARLVSTRSDRFWFLYLLQRLEAEVAKHPNEALRKYSSLIKRTFISKNSQSDRPKPVYRGRLVEYKPSIKSWLALILPFEKAVVFRANREGRSNVNCSTDELQHEFQPGQEVDMIVASLVPDYNRVLFVDASS